MNSLPLDTLEELKIRKELLIKCIKIEKPETAILERQSFAYLGKGSNLYNLSVLIKILDCKSEVKYILDQVKENIKLSISTSITPREQQGLQYALFIYSLLSGDREQTYESSIIIKKMGITDARYVSSSEFFVILANLYLDNKDEVEKLLPKLTKLEEKKNEKYLKPGLTEAISGINTKNINQFSSGLKKMIDGHIHETRYLKWALTTKHFVCEPAVILCSIALKNGIDVKPFIINSHVKLKTRTQFPANRTDLPSTKRFIVPVDLIPDYMLEPWRMHLV
ncbi:hypothetical protein [Vibrio ziniensis]|uniref:Uncharacterized protein n=1 Tax=Vibrio ziniensis TaxID=2711221 RepID=A0A6G7CHH1_9VIBR|nr:hypothetical protein [Vibrio ziniensis]QIH41524.1 hypothetical protein G5S32_05750 [Vibrio ziniensis]